MTKSILLWVLLGAILFPGCSPESPLDSTSAVPSNRAVVGQVVDGNPQMTVESAQLRIAFKEVYGVESAYDFAVEDDGQGGYVLTGYLESAGDIFTNFAIELEIDPAGELGFGPLTESHSCSSWGNCSGCSLKNTPGGKYYCKCISISDPWAPMGGACDYSSSPSIAGENKTGANLEALVRALN